VFGRSDYKHKLEKSRDKKREHSPYIPTFFVVGLVAVICFMMLFAGIGVASAATITVSGDTTTDIQNAIDLASPGDTVFIPAGMYKYTETIDVNTPNLLIKGVGVDYNNPTAGTYIYTDVTTGWEFKIMEITADNVRVTGIAFRGHPLPPVGELPGSVTDWISEGIRFKDVENVHIDHNYFTSFGFSGVRCRGANNKNCSIDHNWLVDNYLLGLGYGVALGTTTHSGVPGKVFIEDNYFKNNRHDVAAGSNSYYVARHNYCYNNAETAQAPSCVNFDAHGPKDGYPGTYRVEVYNNHVEHEVKAYGACLMRGVVTDGIIHNNTFKTLDYGTVFSMAEGGSPTADKYYIWDNTYIGVNHEIKISGGEWDIYRYAPSGYTPDPYPHPLNDDPCHPSANGVFICQNTGTISGTVTNTTGAPIEGATISANGYSSITNTTGGYTITNVPVGTYPVTCTKAGYEVASEPTVVVNEDETTHVDFVLTPIPTGTISGTVTDADTGLAIEGARVSTGTISATTGSGGTYIIADAPVGTYPITCSKAGYIPSTQTVTVTEGETTTADFQLTPATDIVGEWHFDEGSEEIAMDSSGNGNDGTIYGATWTKGKLGSALQFDGSDDYIEVSKSASLDSITNEIALIAWVNTPVSAEHSVMERWLYGSGVNERAFEFDINDDGSIDFGLSADGTSTNSVWLTSNNTINANTWTHLAATSDGTTMKIYINGKQDLNTAVPPAGIHPSTTDLHIGKWEYNTGIWAKPFNGTTDEVRIYNRALSAEEIKADYEAGLEDTTPPASISDLQNTTGTTWINWTWTNPTDADFNHTTVYLEGVWQTNTSSTYYNATGLIANTTYEIGTHTVDTNGNVNTTWVNQTTKTVNNLIPRYDVNEDGTVDILDTTIVGQHFGETTSPPYPCYDVNEDGTVDILDTTIVGQHFGELTS
jgi:hypothetical protein